MPTPNIPAQNAATALQVIEVLGLKLDESLIAQVFKQTSLPGRRQLINNHPSVMLDVAHNPQATLLLSEELANLPYQKVIAVVAMLQDKDIKATLAPMLSVISHWHCASLQVPRGAKSDVLVSAVSSSKQKVLDYESVETAYKMAVTNANKNDLVIVFGSFFTVASVLNMGELTPQEKV